MVSNMIDLRRRPCSQSATLRYCTVYTAATYLLDMHILYIVCLGGTYTQTMICGYFFRFLIPSPTLWTILVYYSINVDYIHGLHCL